MSERGIIILFELHYSCVLIVARPSYYCIIYASSLHSSVSDTFRVMKIPIAGPAVRLLFAQHGTLVADSIFINKPPLRSGVTACPVDCNN